MEKYKKILLIRIMVMGACTFLMLIAYILSMKNVFNISSNSDFSDFHKGFQMGIFLSIEIIFVYLITRYTIVLQKPEELKKLYCAEYDERMILIREKSGGYPLFCCGFAIIIAAIIFGYFNEIVFFTLLACAIFLFVVRKVLRIYYSKKL